MVRRKGRPYYIHCSCAHALYQAHGIHWVKCALTRF